MKNKILGGVFLLVCLFMFCFKFNLVFAENELGNFILRPLPGTEVKTTVTELANVNIGNLQVIQDKNSINKFQIIFDISNDGAEAQGSLVYGIELLKRENTQSQEMVSLDVQYFPQETFSLNAKGLIQKKIEYTFPQFLTGKAELWLKVKNASGLSMGSAMSEVNLNGAGQYVELANPCYFTINDNQKEYNLIQGVDITKEETLFFNCQVINQTDQSVELQPEQTIYRRSSVNEKEKTVLSTEKITLPAKKSVLIKIKVENPEIPQAYDIAFNLKKDNTLFSNTVFGHFVLNGKSGMINLASFDKDAYLASDVAMLSVLLSGPADGFVGARNKKSVLSEPQLEIKITNEKNIQCAKNFKEKIDYFGEVKKISIPIETDCRNFTALVQLKDGERILDEKEIIINSTSQKIATDKQVIDKPEAKKNFLLWVVLILLILPLVVALIHWRKKKKIHLTFSVVLFSCLVSSSMLFTNLVMANTVQLENCFLVGESSASGVSFESDLRKCDTTVCGSVSSTSSRCYLVQPFRDGVVGGYMDIYNNGCNAAVFASIKSYCLQVVKDNGLTTPCSIVSYVGYADCPPPVSAFRDTNDKFWDAITRVGCYCDKVNFDFNLDKIFPDPYAYGGAMRITGNMTAVAACNNGMTAGIKYDAFSGTHTFDWLVGATGPVDLKKTTQSSSSFIKIETVPTSVALGNNSVYFKYGFLHGTGVMNDIFASSNPTQGISTIPYRVASVPASPLILTGSCDVSGNISLNWSGGPITPAYHIRIDETSNNGQPGMIDGWYLSDPPDLMLNNFAGGKSFVYPRGIPGKYYNTWIHPADGSLTANTPIFQCPLNPVLTLTSTITQTVSSTCASETFNIDWSSINATSCKIEKTINGVLNPIPWATGLTGLQIATPWQIGTHIFTLTCTNGTQTAINYVAHTVIDCTLTPTPCTPNPQCVQGDCSSQCGGSVPHYCQDMTGCTSTPSCPGGCPGSTPCSACSSGEWREVAP